MDAALYWSIWIALTLFAAGEAGKRVSRDGRVGARWAWSVSAAGAAVLIVHIAIAMGARHGWSHAAAWSATAQQTASVYGLAWGGGVYFNYAFLVVWLFELWHWRRSPERQARQPAIATWAIRLFFLVIIFNAAIVFAGGWRRYAGVVIVLVLIASWRPPGPWPFVRSSPPVRTRRGL